MSADAPPTPSDAPPPAPRKPPGLWARHGATILTVGLALYAAALAFAVADDVLHLGYFPTRLEQMTRGLIDRFDHPDPAERQRAADELCREIDAFVAVPELFRALESDSLQRRTLAVECLRRTAKTSNAYQPDAPSDQRRAALARWRQWWTANRDRF